MIICISDVVNDVGGVKAPTPFENLLFHCNIMRFSLSDNFKYKGVTFFKVFQIFIQ